MNIWRPTRPLCRSGVRRPGGNAGGLSELASNRKAAGTLAEVSAAEIIDDLNQLRDLMAEERDPARSRGISQLRRRVASRAGGAKVSEAAQALGVSAPTVRSWIELGVLQEMPESSPRRVDILRLADVKRIVDLLRADGHDRELLPEVRRRLRDDVSIANGAAQLDEQPLELDEHGIAELCRRFHVRRLSVFGSATTADFDPDTSDVDFLVDFEEGAEDLFGSYFGLKEQLEQLLGRPVDLAMSKSLENPYFAESVERTRRDLYAA
jgi:predicted nucleotidyltransferase/transposase-like protein